ncbi:glycosyltransferase [Actinomadura scrupuli]|uniref:glycosyltransferase n=1 Tax=Actinomadura scrupuli TaxID=559629 RepID=UPI003D992801
MSSPERPLVTVVVPTRDAARTLAACLASIRAQTYPELEVIVVDNDSADGTRDIAAGPADRVLVHGPERSAQRNHGWRAGSGELVAFIDADMVLDREVVAEAVAAFAADPGLGGLVIPEQSFGEGFLAGCRAAEKRSYLGDAEVEAARIFRREAVRQAGGYAEELTAFEDWDLNDRVAAAGHRIGRVTACVRHDEGRMTLRSAYRKRRYYGRWLPVYRARPGARSFGRPQSVRRLLRHGSPPMILGLIALKVAEAAGLAVGSIEGRRLSRRT